ncbi:MAG: class I SAM-dependent methyltransferase [Pseudomonadota bacterium]
MSQSAVNQATYNAKTTVERYTRLQALFPAEQQIFDAHAQQFGGRVLDIGIGAGRTTHTLLPRCREYVGIDFSASMVQRAKAKFQSGEFLTMDMRTCPAALSGRMFDAILISFNSIDYLPWEDRNQLLTALRALLHPCGVLAFSTHILSPATVRGFFLPAHLRPGWRNALRNPFLLLLTPLRFVRWIVRALPNRLRHRHLERVFDGYAYLNDPGELYGLITTYVTVEQQNAELTARGYRVRRVPAWPDRPSYFEYFVCRPAEQ